MQVRQAAVRVALAIATAACLFTAAEPSLHAQDPAPGVSTDTYKVDFQIREDNAKVRKYSMMLDAAGNGSFRVGTKVPFATSLASNGVGTAYSYVDTGVNITTRVRRATTGKVSLHAEVEISAAQNPGDKAAPNPTLSNIKAVVSTFVTPKKPALIASIEDPSTARKFDVEVTVTPIE